MDYSDSPWKIDQDGSVWCAVADEPIALMTNNSKYGDGLLVAAAPDMLEALMSIAKAEHSYCSSYGNCECAGVAEKALIKAGFIGEGEL